MTIDLRTSKHPGFSAFRPLGHRGGETDINGNTPDSHRQSRFTSPMHKRDCDSIWARSVIDVARHETIPGAVGQMVFSDDTPSIGRLQSSVILPLFAKWTIGPVR